MVTMAQSIFVETKKVPAGTESRLGKKPQVIFLVDTISGTWPCQAETTSWVSSITFGIRDIAACSRRRPREAHQARGSRLPPPALLGPRPESGGSKIQKFAVFS